MTLNILQLPPELVAHVLRFLSSSDLATFALVSKQCRDLVNLEALWQHRCVQDYKYDGVEGWNLTYKEFYTKVLCKFGNCIGKWQPEIGHYGGLIDIKFDRGCIKGRECLPPVDPHVDQPLRIRPLFSIHLAEDLSKVEVFCLKGFNGLHKGQLSWGEDGQLLMFECSENNNHQHPEGKQKEFEDWLTQETGRPPSEFFVHGQELLLMKFLVTTQLGCSYPMMRVMEQPRKPGAVIQPGLFKGNYGGHGIEIIQLSYSDTENKAEGKKITGDPNVPANKVSLYIDLDHPMILTMGQQKTVELMEEIDIPELPPDIDLQHLPPQPFHVPDDCYERFSHPPTMCRARFHGQGQIAGHGFTNPSMSSGHFIIFDDNNFGFLWLELKSFSMYSRVQVFPCL
ncbi:F-box only protein 31-like [Haliotis rubra]|uniref:F-box only protein 31-like n=1 Tax=Haliotis rubra TaxID=36100 RepID=UPI001EE587A5|nr:F-box only protein 31-like [Haliotis rubra]